VALFGAQGDGMQKAKTIDDLLRSMILVQCKDCHADVHAEWEKSLHARSIFGPAEVGRTAGDHQDDYRKRVEGIGPHPA